MHPYFHVRAAKLTNLHTLQKNIFERSVFNRRNISTECIFMFIQVIGNFKGW